MGQLTSERGKTCPLVQSNNFQQTKSKIMYIPKTVLQAFRKFANAFLDRPIRKLAADVGIHATANGCTLQVSYAGKSVYCTVACKDGDEALTESVSISCDLFEELAQSTGDIEFGPVESTENGSRFVVRWQTGLAIRHAELDTHEPPALVGDSIPLTNIGDWFLQCLAHAIEVTDEASIRYSLGCVQLDGRDGTMAATDGGHLVRFDGFDFPWKSEAVLVRKSRLFALKDFVRLNAVSVGFRDKTIVIASGPWRFSMQVETDARFPKVDQVIPDRQRSTNRVQIDPGDRDALSSCLSQLPGNTEELQPVILDLNGHVAVVGKSNQGTSCTVCLELDRSLHLGPDLRTGTPRHNLAFAAKIGSDSLFLYGKDKPILACGPKTQYVWMPLLNQDLAVDLAQTQCIRTSTVAGTSKCRRAS